MLENILCVIEKIVYSTLAWWSGVYMSIICNQVLSFLDLNVVFVQLNQGIILCYYNDAVDFFLQFCLLWFTYMGSLLSGAHIIVTVSG